MRLFVKILAADLIGFLLICVIGLVWIFFYSRDLPDIKALAKFTPPQETRVSDPCLTTASVAIPYESIGNNLRTALSAAEAGEGIRNSNLKSASDAAVATTDVGTWHIVP
jgi:membrane carboxypeptidase/penicillin-binding protein